MKKIFSILAVLILLTSCKKDFEVTLTGVEFHPVKNYEAYSEETEFLGPVLIFSAEFSSNPDRAYPSLFAPKVRSINFLNPVLESLLSITSNRDFILMNDTLYSGENLIDLFEYKMNIRGFQTSYKFRSTNSFLNENGYYMFYFTSVFSDMSVASDSCLVKITF